MLVTLGTLRIKPAEYIRPMLVTQAANTIKYLLPAYKVALVYLVQIRRTTLPIVHDLLAFHWVLTVP